MIKTVKKIVSQRKRKKIWPIVLRLIVFVVANIVDVAFHSWPGGKFSKKVGTNLFDRGILSPLIGID